MATVKNFGIAGVSSDVQWGKGGGRLLYDGTDFGVFASDGTTLTQLDVALVPTQDEHAASKQYVDSVATGLDVKTSVRVATSDTSDLTGFTYENGSDDNSSATPLVWTGAGSAIFDGVTLSNGDRVLIKDASDPRGNGIFTYDAGSGFRRANDADNTPSNEVSGGMFTFIEEGSAADTGWVMSSPQGNAILGTDNLTFSQFSGAGTFTDGDGIDITSNTISVDVHASSQLDFISGQLDIVGGTTGQVLVSDGTRFTAGAIDLANGDAVSGVLAEANGGTGESTYTQGDLLIGDAGSGLETLALGTDNFVLKSNGTTAVWEMQDAADVSFTPSGTITASTVQTAIEELDTTISSIDVPVDSVFGRTGTVVAEAGDYNADQITVTPFADVTATDVQTALEELKADIDAFVDTDNQSAAEVPFTPSGTITSSNVQDAIEELDASISAIDAPVDSVFGRTGAVVAEAGDYNAAQVTVTPFSDITATDVQAALEELKADIDAFVDTDDQTAAEVSFAPTGTLSSTTVQTAIAELDTTVSALDFTSIQNSGGTTIVDTDSTADSVDLTANSNLVAQFQGVASAVNQFVFTNAATGNGVEIEAVGTDTNIDIVLTPKGSGEVILGSTGDASLSTDAGDNLTISTGDNSGGDAGDITFDAGDSTSGDGGSIIIKAGAGSVNNGDVCINDHNNNEVACFEGVDSAVNNFRVSNSATGNAVSVSAEGDDTDIDINFLPKGTGVLTVVGTTDYEDNVTDDDDIPNKAYVDSAISTSLSSSVATVEWTVDLSSAGQQDAASAIPANARVMRVYTNIGTASDAATTLLIRTANDTTLQSTAENDPESTGLYVSEGFVLDAAGGLPEAVVATPGSTGSATVLIEYRLA